MSSLENVNLYYQNSDEDKRMEREPIENLRCKEIISRYLISDQLTILDCGGATGAFSFWLTGLGHSVTLFDFVEKHIELARLHEKELGITLADALVGDARNIPFQNDNFDIVLLMGPLYHLLDKNDRAMALKEALRVLKPGGTIICEVISRFASLVDGFKYDFVLDNDFITIMEKDIATGVHIDTSKSKMYFTDAYFHKPYEVSSELLDAGFIQIKEIAVTGFANTLINLSEKLKDDNYRNILLQTLNKLETEPSLLGISSHLMGIATK